MKSILSKTMMLLAIAATLLSFSAKLGGEGFEISLNGKVVLQKYGNDMNNVKSLQLSQVSSNDQLTIRYHHCGRVGKNRILTIKDGQNNLLKEWRFADATTPVSPMNFKVKDILSLKKTNSSVLNLYYSSSELPDGRLLTTIISGSNAVASNR